MEVAGPLGTPLGLAQRKRASPRGKAGTSGFLCVSDSDRRVPAASCPQFFPASGSFQMSQLFASGGQNIAVSASVSPSNENPGLISPRMDWLDLLDVQETLKSLLQHNSSKASILWCSAFFIVQLSHPYMTTEKNHSFD